jgi:hypothetical protein
MGKLRGISESVAVHIESQFEDTGNPVSKKALRDWIKGVFPNMDEKKRKAALDSAISYNKRVTKRIILFRPGLNPLYLPADKKPIPTKEPAKTGDKVYKVRGEISAIEVGKDGKILVLFNATKLKEVVYVK